MGAMADVMWECCADTFRDVQLLMVGLDAAGKTTLLQQLKLGETLQTVPTIGFNVETIEWRRLRLNIWDVGGQEEIRKLWHHYYHGIRGVIFVLDSTYIERIDVARDALHTMLEAHELSNSAVLVFANKQDLPGALTTCEAAKRLSMGDFYDHRWFIQPMCAITGEGIQKGIEWLARSI